MKNYFWCFYLGAGFLSLLHVLMYALDIRKATELRYFESLSTFQVYAKEIFK